jgi:hypothetical protein
MADNTPAGWYPDPSGDASRQRYWDGTTWTERYQSVATAAGTTPPGGYAPSTGPNGPASPPYYGAAPDYAQPLPSAGPQGATASLVLGIISLVVLLLGFCIPFSGAISIVTGFVGAYQGSKANKIQKTSQATAGFVMSVISLSLSLLWIIILIILFAIGLTLGALTYSF